MASLTHNIRDNIDRINKYIPANFNVIKKELVLKEDVQCIVMYINGIADKDYIDRYIVWPLLFKLDRNLRESEDPIEYIAKRYVVASNMSITDKLDQISFSLMEGKTVIFIEGCDSVILCSTTFGKFRPVEKSDIEKAVKGSKESFTENLEINMALIQKNLRNSNLKFEHYILGRENGAKAVLAYVDGLIDSKVLQNIKSKIDAVNAREVLAVGYIEQFTDKHQLSPFPMAKSTEKPIKVVSDLLQGKAALIMDNTPTTIVMPSVFIEFFQGAEDYFQRLLLANFVRIIRLLAAFIVISAAPVYLVLLQYNSELLPLRLITIIIDSRKGIPLPPFFEILTMEIIIEFLREGGLRLPAPLGQTIGIVGGIVIGDASIRAGLVSPTTLVIVSTSAISTFLIPYYDMALAVRLIRFPLLLLAQTLGFLGVVSGIFFIIISLIRMNSYGVPYLAPLAPVRFRDIKDTFVRGTLVNVEKPPVTYQTNDAGGKADEKKGSQNQ